MNGHRYDRHAPGDYYSNHHHQSSYRCDLLANEPLSRSHAQQQRCSSPPTEKKSQQIHSTYSSMAAFDAQTERRAGFDLNSILNHRSLSTAYYDQIHQQVRLRESRKCNSPDERWNPKPSFIRDSIQTAPTIPVASTRRTLSPAQVTHSRWNDKTLETTSHFRRFRTHYPIRSQ